MVPGYNLKPVNRIDFLHLNLFALGQHHRIFVKGILIPSENTAYISAITALQEAKKSSLPAMRRLWWMYPSSRRRKLKRRVLIILIGAIGFLQRNVEIRHRLPDFNVLGQGAVAFFPDADLMDSVIKLHLAAGQSVIREVTDEMLIVVPEGEYSLYISNNGVAGSKESLDSSSAMLRFAIGCPTLMYWVRVL